MIALAALTVVGIPSLPAMGLAAAATVAVTVLIAITLVPAVLAVLGPRLDKGRLPFIGRRVAVAEEAEADAAGRRFATPMGER